MNSSGEDREGDSEAEAGAVAESPSEAEIEYIRHETEPIKYELDRLRNLKEQTDTPRIDTGSI